MEAIASLFGRITAMKRRHPSRYTEGDADAETSLDVHVRVAMRTMKERLACLREGPLQASGRREERESKRAREREREIFR